MGVSRRRREYFRAAIEARGFRCSVLSWQQERQRRADTREQRQRWLVHRLTELPKPLAVFARDNEAVEVLEACFAGGITIPDQVAVLGVDNTEFVCDCLRVPLSSIDNNLAQVGYEGAMLLARLIRGETAPASPIYVPPIGIVERRSTDNLATEHSQVAAALRFIRENADQQIGMIDIVRHVAMSRSGLEKAFREHFVRAPIEQLRHTRLELAKKMLRGTDEKIAAIAQQTGFQTPDHLCRVFQRQLGLTPKQYRAARKASLSRLDKPLKLKPGSQARERNPNRCSCGQASTHGQLAVEIDPLQTQRLGRSFQQHLGELSFEHPGQDVGGRSWNVGVVQRTQNPEPQTKNA
jgi:LacI family transcriptional regulator